MLNEYINKCISRAEQHIYANIIYIYIYISYIYIYIYIHTYIYIYMYLSIYMCIYVHMYYYYALCIICIILYMYMLFIYKWLEYSDATEKGLTVCSCHVTYFYWVKLFKIGFFVFRVGIRPTWLTNFGTPIDGYGNWLFWNQIRTRFCVTLFTNGILA